MGTETELCTATRSSEQADREQNLTVFSLTLSRDIAHMSEKQKSCIPEKLVKWMSDMRNSVSCLTEMKKDIDQFGEIKKFC